MFILSQYQREKLAYQYTVALEQGDMEHVSRILVLAEADSELEQIILEMNQVLESEYSFNQSVSGQETIMPVFMKEKRKRHHKRPLWTASIAVLVSILFSGFALFFTTQSNGTSPAANVESIRTDTVDRISLAYQFLEAWNNNSPQTIEDVLADDFLYYESTLIPLNKRETQQRINQLNGAFNEVHFMLDDITQTETRLSANITLKAQHADMVAFNRSYIADGTIEFVFADDKIIKVAMDIDLDRFSAEYGAIRTDAQNDLITHVIQEGETMYGIVNEYGIPHTLIPAILEYNGFDGEDGAKSMTVGTVLQIPAPNSTLILSPPDDFDARLQSKHIEITDEDVIGLRVYIEAGETNLRLGSVPDTVFMADIENFGDYDYIENGTQVRLISIVNHPYQILKANGERPTWYFKVSEKTFTDLNIRGGNGDMMLDLSEVNLQGLQLTIGAGELTLNLPDTGTNYEVVVKTLSDDATVTLSYPDSVSLIVNANDGIWQKSPFNAKSAIHLNFVGNSDALDIVEN